VFDEAILKSEEETKRLYQRTYRYQYQQKYREQNKEKVYKQQKKYYEKNKEKKEDKSIDARFMQKAKPYKKKPIFVSAEGFLVLMDKKSP
jgi:hypothetical protein